jgi:O-antigen/teichoic acid export membrane protein
VSSESFKSLLKREIKDASIYSAVTFSLPVINMLLIPFYWKVLTPTDYGVIAIVGIIGGVTGVFLGLSIDQYINRFYYEWAEEDRSIEIGTAWLLSWGSSFLIGIISIPIIFLITPYLFPKVNFFPYIFLGLLSQIFNSLDVVAFATLRIKRLPKMYSIYQLSKSGIVLCFNILFVLILDYRLEGYFIANLVSSIIITGIALKIMLIFATPSLKKDSIRVMFRFSLPLVGNNFVAVVSSTLDSFLLQYYASVEALGIYSVGMKFASILSQLHKALKLSYGPFVFEKLKKNNGLSVISRVTVFYVFPLFFAATGIILFIDDLVYWINQSSYFPIVEFVPYLIITALIQTLVVYYGAGIIISKRTELLLIPTTIQALLVIGLSFVLIPTFQIYGIIVSRFIGALIFLLISIIITLRVYPLMYKWVALFGFWITTLAIVGIHQNVGTVGWIQSLLISVGLMICFCFISLCVLYFSTRDTIKT